MATTRKFTLATLTAPFSWTDLRGLVDQVNLKEPQRQERISCRIGVGGVLYVEVEREMTPIEELAERLGAAEAKLSQLNGLFHADGTPVPDLVERLRRIARS